MGLRRTPIITVVTVVALAMVIMARFSAAQQDADCAQKLVPCQPYLNSTTSNPPASCCDPIKLAVATQLQCLCTLYTTPGLLESLGVKLADAIRLTQSCGVPIDMSKCNTSSLAPQTAPPPPVAGSPGNVADRKLPTKLQSLFLVSASLMLFFWAS